jgi:hypothetical protein
MRESERERAAERQMLYPPKIVIIPAQMRKAVTTRKVG